MKEAGGQRNREAEDQPKAQEPWGHWKPYAGDQGRKGNQRRRAAGKQTGVRGRLPPCSPASHESDHYGSVEAVRQWDSKAVVQGCSCSFSTAPLQAPSRLTTGHKSTSARVQVTTDQESSGAPRWPCKDCRHCMGKVGPWDRSCALPPMLPGSHGTGQQRRREAKEPGMQRSSLGDTFLLLKVPPVKLLMCRCLHRRETHGDSKIPIY